MDRWLRLVSEDIVVKGKGTEMPDQLKTDIILYFYSKIFPNSAVWRKRGTETHTAASKEVPWVQIVLYLWVLSTCINIRITQMFNGSHFQFFFFFFCSKWHHIRKMSVVKVNLNLGYFTILHIIPLKVSSVKLTTDIWPLKEIETIHIKSFHNSTLQK